MLALDPNAQVASSTEVRAIPAGATLKRTVVLAAGYDYERNPNSPPGSMHFSIYCKNRVANYIEKNPAIEKDDNWKFVLFDVHSGKVSENTFDKISGIRDWRVINSYTFKPVTQANYTDKISKYPEFDAGPRDKIISIMDVYKYVREIGANAPGSLWELSFISHGYHGGPILVNYVEDNKERLDREANLDKDGRIAADFSSVTLTDAERADFQNAFHPQGYSWTWGCNFDPLFHAMLHEVTTNVVYKKAGGPLDTDVFTLTFTDAQAAVFFSSATWFFPKIVPNKSYYSFTKTFHQIKSLFRSGLKSVYSYLLASESRRVCYGASPGTFAGYSSEAFQQMIVSEAVFSQYLKFYTTHLGVEMDPEKRYYIGYQP